jgi:pimeloyl-ACP methyl ester carboxylesterase
MIHPEPSFREAGAGPGVVCIHANASTSGQWRPLMEALAPGYRVLAPDSYGSGKSPAWSSDRAMSLDDEVDFLEPVFTRAGSPFTLIGHSYGAAVALIAALRRPDALRALVLYEPTLFALIDANSPPPNDADGIRNTVRIASAALDAGDRSAAAETFIDYWMGQGSWANMPPERKAPIADSVTNIPRWARALLTEPTPLSAFARLDIPTLYMIGNRSPTSALGVARLLAPALPRAKIVTFDGVGHMGPITHPGVVSAAISTFLAEV